ncbi:recombinase RecT [Streptomyces sp. FH025]|uniref:recombinase RecT n=1 Tax=Streptomyces sp. FH025 TaxID=2815937 RepID=UPI001A9EB4CE|nr:recombinase RecT [Streptomyces sp. FH025]MBO1413210.1 recombinase RecT [Streptomyces sp. FH025]
MTTPVQQKPVEAEPITPLTDNRAEMSIQTAEQVLEITADQRFWTKAQRAALAAIGLAQAPTHDLVAFFHICKSTGLDPFRREIYYIQRKRKVGKQEELYYTAQTGIDGFRHIGQRTGRFIRRVGPFWTGPEDDPKWWIVGEDGINRRRWVDVWLHDNPPAAAMCRIEHRSIAGDETVTQAVAVFAEFAVGKDEWRNDPHTGEGFKTGKRILTGQWPTMGAHMIGKVAEAQAWRIAFPRELVNIYEHAEMEQADAAQRELEREAGAARRRDARSQEQPGVVVPGTVVSTSTTETADGATGQGTPEREPGTTSGEPAGEPPTADELRQELRAYASAMGSTVTKITDRWRKATGIGVNKATAGQLGELLAELRPYVLSALGSHPEAAEHVEAGGLLIRLDPDTTVWSREDAREG